MVLAAVLGVLVLAVLFLLWYALRVIVGLTERAVLSQQDAVRIGARRWRPRTGFARGTTLRVMSSIRRRSR